MFLNFKVLKSDKDLSEFCEHYKNAISKKSIQGFDLRLSDISKKTKVVGVFQKGEMIAGYAISDVPYSCLANISDENKKKMESLAPLDSYYDLGNIWKKPGFSKNLFKTIVWPTIVKDTIFFNSKKKNIIGYVFTGHGRADAYSLTKPVFLQTSERMNDLNIFSMTRKGMVLGFIQGIVQDSLKGPLSLFMKKTSNSQS